jgi:hypothetical protein
MKTKPSKKITAPVKKAAKTPTLPKSIVVPQPTIIEKKTKRVTAADLVEVADTNLLVSIDLRRMPDKDVFGMEIEEGQRLFPYTVLPRFLIGWQSLGLISSFELKLTSDYPLPQIIVRFAEKLLPEDVAKLDPGVRAQYDANIALLRGYPFVTIESPLLTAPSAG